MPDLLRVFETEGTAREVAGNLPLLLDDSEAIWLVAAGRVDVFAVPVEQGRQTHARIHLFRAEAGQVLFGMVSNGPAAELMLLAAGVPGTSVLRLPRARLMEAARDPALAGQVGALIDGWVQGFTAGVATDRIPRKCALLEPGKEVVLEAGGKVNPARGTLWVRHLEGSSLFLGKTGLPLVAADGFFPLPASGWLGASGPTRLQVVSTEALAGDPALGSGLEGFHQVILRCIALNAQEADAADRERLQQRAEADHRLVQASLTRLAAVTGTSPPDGLAEEGEPDALLRACQLVGRAMAIDVERPADLGEGRKRSGRLGEVARASRFRIRRVLLAGDWWRTDNGPLLAFRKDGDQPVALLPTSAESYELADPTTPTRTAVTPEVADTLACFAFSFYRPFPTRALDAWDLVRFGILGCRKDLGGVILLAVAGGLLGLLPPIVTGLLFDRIVPGAQRNQLLLVTLALVVSAFAAAMFQLTRGIAILRVEGKLDSAVEAGIWDRLLSLPVPFFRRYTAGDLTTRAMGISLIRQLLTGVVVSSILTSVFSFFNLGLLFFYDLRLAGVAALLMGIVLVATVLTVYLQLRYQRTVYQVRGKIAGMVLQFITGIARLRVAGAEERALAIWARDFSTQKRSAFEARSIANQFTVFNAGLPVVTAMAIFATVALLQDRGLSVGTFLAFNAAFVQLLAATLSLSASLDAVVRAVPLYERVKPILESLPEVHAAMSDPGELSGEIEISHVSFRYQPDGPVILDDVSLHIRPGTFVALVGPSGSGKSSILRLLLGFETPGSGSIYYDRQDLAGLDLQAVRRQIGVVLQNGKVISGDILTNIIGSSLLTLQDAWEAARLSGLDEDIRQMPMQMHTIITEGGSTLSGGQRQRLMIARAIVSRPRVLFFDEATSALDNKTQAVVSKSLEDLKATRVVVAHRLSTIMNADWIYVMEAGKIVQQGTYEDLIRQKGLFGDLARRQLA